MYMPQAARTALAEQAQQLQDSQQAQQRLRDSLAVAEAAAAADSAQLAAAAEEQKQHTAQIAASSAVRNKAARLSGEVERLTALGNEDRAALNAAERKLAAQAQVFQPFHLISNEQKQNSNLSPLSKAVDS